MEGSKIFDLPMGWTIASLGDIVEINPRHPKSLDDSLPVTFVPMSALSETGWPFHFSEERELGDVRKGYTHFAEGDVLFAKITPCMENGKAALAIGLKNGIGCGTTELHVLRPRKEIEAKYLYYFIHRDSFRKEAAQQFTGTAGQLRVPVSFIRKAEIPLPSANDQRRIVAKLEKLLARVDACRERLDKIPALLKRFRQSVLAAACSGRLTADWRKDDSETKAGIADANDFPEVPTSWYWDHIAGLFKVETGTTPPKKDPTNYSHTPTDCPLFKPTDLDASANVREGREWISKKGERFSRILPPFTVCVTSIGATIGKTGLLQVRGATNQQINAILPSESILPQFTFFFCCSPYFQHRIVEESSSTTLPIINKGRFEKLEFPVPPFAEQQEIVRRVEALFKTADQIEVRYKKAKVHIEKLTQSIFGKAFRGELVPQDPNGETVSALLTSIRQERKNR